MEKNMTQPIAEKKPGKSIHNKKYIDKKNRIERDLTKVRGIFRCEEERGGTITFHFKKYKDIPLERYTLTDGHTYELPLMVAEHLAQNCWYPVNKYAVDKEGNPSQIVGKKVKRYDFISSDFVTENQDYQRIVTIENVEK